MVRTRPRRAVRPLAVRAVQAAGSSFTGDRRRNYSVMPGPIADVEHLVSPSIASTESTSTAARIRGQKVSGDYAPAPILRNVVAPKPKRLIAQEIGPIRVIYRTHICNGAAGSEGPLDVGPRLTDC